MGDLPEVVREAVNTRYPQSTIQESMEVTAMVDGNEVLEGYEVVLKTSDGKEVELRVSPNGEILEDSEE